MFLENGLSKPLNLSVYKCAKMFDLSLVNECKIFHSSAKLIANDSDINEAFKSMHQSIMKKMKNYVCEDWIVLDVNVKHSIKICAC